MKLLTADWHLTDNPDEEYRWGVFDVVRKQMARHRATALVILGDLADRKDRHSAALLNRMRGAFMRLAEDCQQEIMLFPGNHDMPIVGESFWTFLDDLPNVTFISQPAEWDDGRALVLPYTDDPVAAWDDFDLGAYEAIFMHQPVNGATEKGRTVLTKKPFPELPPGPKVYSGDIHTPQVVGPVRYVGAPHPIKFGDRYRCQMLLVDHKYRVAKELELAPIARHMLRVGSIDKLKHLPTQPGDQAQVVFELGLDAMARWPAIRDEIQNWAVRAQVRLFSIEPSVVIEKTSIAGQPLDDVYYGQSDPADVLVLFAEQEGIAEVPLEAGVDFLRAAVARRAAL